MVPSLPFKFLQETPAGDLQTTQERNVVWTLYQLGLCVDLLLLLNCI